MTSRTFNDPFAGCLPDSHFCYRARLALAGAMLMLSVRFETETALQPKSLIYALGKTILRVREILLLCGCLLVKVSLRGVPSPRELRWHVDIVHYYMSVSAPLHHWLCCMNPR